MSSVPPLKRCKTFLRLATSDTASATPEDQGPIMKRAPSPSIASSARRVEVPACVAPSRVTYLIGRPRIFMPRSSSAMRMPRSLSGPTSAKAPVWSHRPRITTSFACARTMAGKPSAAAPAAPNWSSCLRFMVVSLGNRRETSLHRFGPRRSHVFADRPDRAHLDAADRGRRDAGGDLDGLVQVARLDQVEAGEAFLGLGEGPVGDRDLAVSHPHGGSGGHRLQGFRGQALAARAHRDVELHAVAVVHRLDGALFAVHQAQVLHGRSPRSRVI